MCWRGVVGSSPTPIMTTSLLAPAQWAQTEFALAELGDQRLTQRLVQIATGLARNPGGTLPQAFPEMKDLKAAYRFFSQPKVGPPQIQRPHGEQTQARCREPGEYLLIEDTSELDYSSHPGCADLGSIGNGRGRGLLLHSTLAVRVEAWDLAHRPEGIVVGLMHQQCWKRTGPPKRGREMDAPKRAGSGRAAGRVPGPQARRHARLANHLARLAAVDADV